MNRTTTIGVLIVLGAALIFSLYWVRSQTLRTDAEESEIEAVLKTLQASEQDYFKEHGGYVGDFEGFRLPQTKRPMVIGIVPDCENTNSEPPYIFVGPRDHEFESHARDMIDRKVIKTNCRPLNEGFTAFAAQNLDEDADFELWTIDESGRTEVILSDNDDGP